MCPRSNARVAALAAMSEVNSFAAARRRLLMPVREVIHSSVVSTMRSRSALVSTLAGTYEPTEATEHVLPWKPCNARGFLNFFVVEAFMRKQERRPTVQRRVEAARQSFH